MTNPIHTRSTKTTKILGGIIFLFITAFGVTKSAAQSTGYIYVHSKTLNEAGSPAISYSVSGGTTAVANFTLNDDPAQTIINDIGAAQNGRLWAVSISHELYFRDPLSANWTKTNITGVQRVDGGPNNTCFYISTGGTIFSYSGSGSATQLSTAGQFPASSADIGSGWTSTPYVVNNGTIVYKYSGSGTSWNTYATIGSNNIYRIDVNPTNGNVYVASNNGTTRRIREITPAAVVTILDAAGTPASGDFRDVAVNANGEIYIVPFSQTNPTGWYVFKYTGGTWVKELGSFDGSSITGGVGNSLWLTMNSGGWGNGNGWTPATGPYPFYNIFSRGFNGSEPTYIDDERVRTTPTAGNAQLIPVTPGTYTIEETVPGNWDLQKITIYDPSANSSFDLAARKATVTVAADEVVHVVFQTGEVFPFSMTTDCANAYLETFGTGATGSYGNPVPGQTTYHYLAGNAPGEDGYYKIVNRANPDFNVWGGAAGILDHTVGDGATGYMYAVNAGYDKGEFFRRRFTGVIPGANYSFSAWIVNLTASAEVNPNVSFTVFDHNTQAVLGSFNSGELADGTEPGAWQKYGLSFSATASDIDLVISNNGFGGNGNDLAIDDISFSLSPPTPTIVIKSGSCTNGLGSIEITAPLSAAYEYSVDGSAWQSTPVFDNLAIGAYTVSVRFAGATNCTNSTTSAVINPSICGNVFRDANGLNDTQVNGTLISSAGATPLYVSLYNGATLVSTIPVNPDGSYTFADVAPNSTYSIILGTDPAANVSSPFQGSGINGWVSVGEDCCDNTGGDGTTNGALTVILGTSSVNDANFGIELQPESDPKTTSIAQPTVNQIITLNGGANPPVLSGSDPEDLPAGGVLTTRSVAITAVPTNSELYYNNTLVAAGTTIPNFDPSKLEIKFTAASIGSTSTQFDYAYVDAADVADPTPATYTISWSKPLPVTLVSFDVTKSESEVRIKWATSSETNSSYFDIERSTDARNWNVIGQISAKVNINAISAYDFTDKAPANGINYYRLKMVDMDQSFSYSKIRSVSLEGAKVRIYPNPVTTQLNIDNFSSDQIEKVVLYSMTGMVVYSNENFIKNSIDVARLKTGVYILTITLKNGTKLSRTVVKN
jgi:hypothetical protein